MRVEHEAERKRRGAPPILRAATWPSSNAEHGGAPGEACAEHARHHEVAFLHLPELTEMIERERDARGRGVAVELNGVEYFLGRDFRVLNDRFVDTEVRLMRHEPIDVFPREAGFLERFAGR